jgi:peptidase M28-like protein
VIAALPLLLILQSGPSHNPSTEQAYADAVSEAALRQDVHDLVAFGPRMGGTPSGEKAAALLEQYFTRLGLKTEVFTDPPKPAHWEDHWRVALAAGEVIESAWPYGFSPSIVAPDAGDHDSGRVGPLVLVENLASAQPDPRWKDAVVYTPGDVERAYSAVAASPNRPLAILTSAPNAPPRYMDWSRISELPAKPDNPVPVFGVSYLDGRTLAAAAAANGTARVSLTSHVEQRSPRTVVATLPGRESDKYYLVCAHGDSDAGGPGADDNASGVATVMEMARVFAQLGRDGTLAQPRYGIRFAIWGSESHSSKAYIDREGPKLGNLAGVFNFDETGTGAEREAIYFESNDVPWNAALLETLESVAADYAGKPGFWTEYTTNPSQGGTDSYAFLPKKFHGTGTTTREIPATTIYTAAWDHLADVKQTAGWESKGTADPVNLKIDYSLYYHSSGDTPENTTDREPQNMVKAVKVTGLALMRLNR